MPKATMLGLSTTLATTKTKLPAQQKLDDIAYALVGAGRDAEAQFLETLGPADCHLPY